DKQVFDSSKYTKDIKLTQINPANLTESINKYVKSLGLKLTQLYPMLNNNSDTNFNNSKYSTNENYIN
ncbi:hypothetical protein Z962_11600, partial [Clostridium botulinum C/D str. BKT12695]